MAGSLNRDQKLTLWTAAVTGLISLAALVVSLWANKISHEAYALANKTYSDERRIFLKTQKFDEGGISKGLIFLPLNDDQQVANMTIVFPSKLGISPIVLTPPDLKLYQPKIESSINKYLRSRIDPVGGHVLLAPHYPIQAFVVVQGYTKGVSVVTAGVYEFIFSFMLAEDSEPSLETKAAVLNNYVLDYDDPQTYIDQLFDQFEEYAPHNRLQATQKPRA